MVNVKEDQITIKERKKGFRIHSFVYVCVNSVLITLNLLLVPEFLWFFFPLIGWGFGLTMHYIFGVKRPVEKHQ